jgi:GWxTD domain-containing protein
MTRGAVLALMVCGVVAARDASARDEGPGPLPWRVGGRVGFTVDAAAFPDSIGNHLEVYLRITPATLAAMTQDFKGVARIRVALELRSAHGSKRDTRTQEYDIAAADSEGGFGKVIVNAFAARPGPQRLKVRIEDLISQKRGLAYMGREAHEIGAVDGEFDILQAQGGRDLSTIEFVWGEASEPIGPGFDRNGRTLLPNPERLYGLFADQMRIAFTARSKDATRAWKWKARILDARAQTVAEHEGTEEASATMVVESEFDVSHEPAGGYDCEIQAWQEGDAHPMSRRSRFSVAWQPESWLRNPRETEDLVHFLLRAEEEESFVTMHPGEQERLLDEYWRQRDPTPDTAINENRMNFLHRVDIANERWDRFGLGKGMFADMGRVYIRYGEPSEILRQVIPTGDNTLAQVLAQLSLTENRPLGEIEQKGPGGDIRPFEVWIYDQGEIPLPPDADPKLERNTRRKRLVFLFVDEHGLGDYRLRYSNE